MNPRFKAVTIALVASCGLAITTAPSVQANGTMHYMAPSAPTVFTATQTAPSVIKTSAGEISCATADYDGTQATQIDTSITFTYTVSGCIAFGFANTQMKFNGCDRRLTTPVSRQSAGHYIAAPPQIICPGMEVIEYTPTDPFFGLSVCTVTVPGQTPTAGSTTLQNADSGNTRHVVATFNVSGFHYTVDGGGGLCGKVGITHSDGVHTGTVTLQGYDDLSGEHMSHTSVHEPIEVTGS